MTSLFFKWLKKEDLLFQENLSRNTFLWLTEAYNLTETIKKTGTVFSLKLLGQFFEEPHLAEVEEFKLDASKKDLYLVRKVFLEADAIPSIYARVVVPIGTYLNYKEAFDKLGNAPIGDTILYADKKNIRKEFQYRTLNFAEALFQEINEETPLSLNQIYWLRKALFILPKGSLLITEVFLEPLINYPKDAFCISL